MRISSEIKFAILFVDLFNLTSWIAHPKCLQLSFYLMISIARSLEALTTLDTLERTNVTNESAHRDKNTAIKFSILFHTFPPHSFITPQ